MEQHINFRKLKVRRDLFAASLVMGMTITSYRELTYRCYVGKQILFTFLFYIYIYIYILILHVVNTISRRAAILSNNMRVFQSRQQQHPSSVLGHDLTFDVR